MSHVAAIQVEIKEENLNALKQAIKALGLEFREGQTTYRWYGSWVKDYGSTLTGRAGEDDAAFLHGVDPATYGKDAVHAIGIPGNDQSYEIGVVRRRNSDGEPIGGYTLVWDFFAGGKGLVDFVGNKDAGKLIAEYSKEVLKEKAATEGYGVNETTDAAGNIVLELNSYA